MGMNAREQQWASKVEARRRAKQAARDSVSEAFDRFDAGMAEVKKDHQRRMAEVKAKMDAIDAEYARRMNEIRKGE